MLSFMRDVKTPHPSRADYSIILLTRFLSFEESGSAIVHRIHTHTFLATLSRFNQPGFHHCHKLALCMSWMLLSTWPNTTPTCLGLCNLESVELNMVISPFWNVDGTKVNRWDDPWQDLPLQLLFLGFPCPPFCGIAASRLKTFCKGKQSASSKQASCSTVLGSIYHQPWWCANYKTFSTFPKSLIICFWKH